MSRLLCRSLVALAFATSAAAQAKPVVVEVRSTDAEQILDVDVQASGGAVFGLAVWNGAPGHVFQKDTKGNGTTPLLVIVDPKPGKVRISVPVHFPALRAFVQGDTTKKLAATGHTIDVVRDSTGAVSLINGDFRRP